jgi:hypothetical protein
MADESDFFGFDSPWSLRRSYDVALIQCILSAMSVPGDKRGVGYPDQFVQITQVRVLLELPSSWRGRLNAEV